MKVQCFIDNLKEALEVENLPLTRESNLREIGGFDSMSILTIVAFVDEKFSKKFSAQQLSSVNTIGSLMDLIGVENFE